MIGMCAGMALRGLRPFAYTIATFTLFRPFEFVRDDLCYQNLPVTVVGIGGGVTYSTLGGTHHAMEDVAIAGAIPNLSIIAPCDPAETKAATLWCVEQTRGPVYLRLGKAGEPNLTEKAESWSFGKLRYLQKGDDVCIFSYGPIMKLALQVAAFCEQKGQSVSLVSTHTLKPLDREGIAGALSRHKRAIVIEECVPRGGLAGQVKEIACDERVDCQVDAFTLRDEFIHCYGSHADLLAAHGLDLKTISMKLEMV